MRYLGQLWFRVRMLGVNLVVAAGVVVIAWLQWPQAVQSNCFATSGCSQGLVGTMQLALILAGIPAILFAIAAHAFLTRLLFRRGEAAEYRLRRIIANVASGAKDTARADGKSRRFED